MVSNILRSVVGRMCTLIGWLSRPQQIRRSELEKAELARETKDLVLYDYKGCPKSLKTRRAIHRLNIDIQSCDIRKCQVHQDNLLAQYGKLKAPCLRVTENDRIRWLDEPDEIIAYLNARFDAGTGRYQMSR